MQQLVFGGVSSLLQQQLLPLVRQQRALAMVEHQGG